MRVLSIHLPFELDYTAKPLEEANVLGAHFVVSSTLLPVPEYFEKCPSVLTNLSADQFEKVAAAANRIGAQAKAAGLQFAHHNFEFRDLGAGQMATTSSFKRPILHL